MDWTKFVQKFNCDEACDGFDRFYRMREKAFRNLSDLLERYVIRKQSNFEAEPVHVHVVLHCTLRWLAGASYLDARLSAGLSRSGFYMCVKRGMEAILNCDELAYHFPVELDEVEASAKAFSKYSTNEVITGCVACIDGFLCEIKTPSRSETANVRSYFSGHYQLYGINIQAACDSRSRFLEVCVAAPGGTNDIAAYRKTNLKRFVDNLPVGKYVIGDNAYIASEHLINPFSGTQRMRPENDAFNFYVSQIRIKIEQAFGFMTTKWRILKQPLQVKLKTVPSVILSITRLHNYVINNRSQDFQPLEIEEASMINGIEGEGLGYIPSDRIATEIRGVSVLRETIVSDINSRALSRPQWNISRNSE
eukprot:CAMPEP_0182451238 /NCGR_PEP_ID=MMETSP1172-20130603/43609_1 /TAXON_ID=708627 /ORGANISM="Timspurckia oligopyrenoides, Strain CCMP3278" /LENGTH=363 /DNA_ID=CAMNT_0024648991 /DNA_START=1602 /DNA_END=2693 /DNA_ORIENTATION=+